MGSVLLLAAEFATSPPVTLHPKLERLSSFNGCWSIEGRELASSGDTFAQRGIGKIAVDRAAGGLSFAKNFRVVEAVGEYRRLPRYREAAELLTYDQATRLFAVHDLLSGTGARPARASIAPTGEAIFWSSMIHSSARGIDLFAIHTMRFPAADRIESQTSLRDPHGSFRELYVANWARLPPDDPQCKADAPPPDGEGDAR